MAFIINGQKITDDEIYEEFESIKDHYSRLGEVVCCDRDEEFMGYARENVVNRALLEQESLEKFGEVSAEAIEERIAEMKQEQGGEDEFYENTGFNKGDDQMIHNRVRSGVMVDRVLEEVLGEEPEPTEEELRAYYETNIDRYMSQERVRVSQIFVEPSSHEDARLAYAKLRELREKLLADEVDFDEAAAEYSDKEGDEIDLGFMAQGETMPEIEAITFSMQKDEISPIVATHFGFHIFKITDREEPAPIPLEEINGIKEQCFSERRENKIADYIDELKNKGSVEEIEETASSSD